MAAGEDSAKTASATAATEPQASTAAPPPANSAADDADAAADPDEDDLDDLDDMLDDFSAVKINQKAPASASVSAPKPSVPAASSSAAPAPAPAAAADPLSDASFSLPGDDDFNEEEFQKQLQAGMAELMGDLEGSPDMQAQFENIFKGLSGGAPPSAAGAGSNTSSAVPDSADAIAAELSQDANFQETIKRTMARMQASGDQATAAAQESSEDDFIAQMMKAMKDMPGGDDSEEDMSKLLMGMMEQLTNKEILYEPMKELNDKFPAWMDKNKATLSQDDTKRYEEQQTLVREIVGRFEDSSYSDSNAQDREYIVDRMQKMQAAGSPPTDLVGDMPSAKEVLDGPDDSCAQQ